MLLAVAATVEIPSEPLNNLDVKYLFSEINSETCYGGTNMLVAQISADPLTQQYVINREPYPEQNLQSGATLDSCLFQLPLLDRNY